MNKKNLILGIILIVLVAAAWIYQGPFKDWRTNSGKAKNFLFGVDIDGITAIKIGRFGQETTLEKDGDRWKIGGTKDFYADPDVISAALSALKDAAGAEMTLVSKNEDAKPQFQTDDMTGVKVTLMNGGQEAANFVVGKTGSDYASTYLSPGGAETYSCAAANISYAFSQPDWYDKIIFSSDKNQISQIRFQYPSREFTITEVTENGYEGAENNETATATKTWAGTLPYKFKVSADKVDPILDIMSNLTASDVPAQTFDGTGLEKHNIIIEATGDGFNNTLMIGDDNGDEMYYAKKGDSDNIYLITKEQRDALDKTSMDLR
jgi:hypothetical protein